MDMENEFCHSLTCEYVRHALRYVFRMTTLRDLARLAAKGIMICRNALSLSVD